MSQLRHIFTSILKAISPRQVYLVIDALDECREEQAGSQGREGLLQIITKDSALAHVKWIVSSRRNPLIVQRLKKTSTALSLELNERSVHAAVEEYIKHKVRLLSEIKDYEEGISERVESLLSSKAQSTFLWVALACQMLEVGGGWDPVGLLDGFPRGLDALYCRMLDEVQPRELCEQILAVMLTVFRPVSLLELQALVPLFPKQGNNSEFAKLVQDEAWFIRYHRREIEQSPTLVYAALLFSPDNSMMKKTYNTETPTWVTINTRMEDSLSHNLQSMEGHTEDIVDISFSYDSSLIVSGSFDETVRVWDVVTGESIHVLHGHTGYISSVTFSGSNYQIASASIDKTIRIWDGKQGEIINTLHVFESSEVEASSLALSNDGEFVACGFIDEGVQVWNTKTGFCIWIINNGWWKSQPRPLIDTCVTISRCGRFLASSNFRTASVWDMEQRKNLLEIASKGCNFFPFVRFSSEANLWMVDGNRYMLVDLRTKAIHKIVNKSEMILYDARVSGDRDQLSTPCRDLLTTESDSRVLDWIERLDKISKSIILSPKGNLLASTTGQQIKVWDLPFRNPTSPLFDKFPSSLLCHKISFSPDGLFVFSNPYDLSPEEDLPMSIWHFETGQLQRTIGHKSTLLSTPVISPSGAMVAYNQGRGDRLAIEDMKTGARYHQLEIRTRGNMHRLTGGVFCAHDKFLVLFSLWGINVYYIREEKSIWLSTVPTFHAVFSKDSQYLAVNQDSCIRIWDTATWKFKSTLRVPASVLSPEACIRELVFSNDSSSLALSWYQRSHVSTTRISVWKLFNEEDPQTFELDDPCDILSFDKELSTIETNIGIFELTPKGPCRNGYGLSKDRQWVIWCTERVLWLPPEFRPCDSIVRQCYAVYAGHKIAIGLASGGVLHLQFDPAGPGSHSNAVSVRAQDSALTPMLSLAGC
ncbi:vegetative incompatibility HET-E-1 protein [Fusarium austroafricanum]|uniref:Mitochondrial division protein 1 n=1 Tax=Fusarium austroafricanum TaxID=2364996 RepID=A0A8H4P216_9HYPO|nr:vegetative incompatibility HET-E-1 protein [Fusarium austroafricanum]